MRRLLCRVPGGRVISRRVTGGRGRSRRVTGGRGRSRRVIGAVVAVAAVGALAGCDPAPYAASVDGVPIGQTTLNAEIAYADRSPAYVNLVQTITQQATGTTVSVVGAGTGTHTTQWTALNLNNLIQAAIIHRAVVAQGVQPGPGMLAAARGVLEAEMGATGFAAVPAPYRDELVQRVAEHAELEEPGGDAAQLQQLYTHYLASFYTQVCVHQTSVSVTGADGSIDFAASRTRADQIVAAYSTPSPDTPSPATQGGGTVNCYSQSELQSQPVAFLTTVVSLAPGQASAPQRTSFGYNVIAVTSRITQPFDGNVARALEAVILQREPFIDTAVVTLSEQAHVQVNPAYGSWAGGTVNGVVPGVRPPSAPPGAPGSPATSVPVYDPFAGASSA